MTRVAGALRLLIAFSAPLALTLPLGAQGPRPITQADFDGWKSIAGTALSPDGRWVAYTLTPQVGDGEMIFRATAGTTEHRHARGFTGRPQLQAGATGGGFNPQPARWVPASTHAAFLIYPDMEASERARRARTRPADQPRNSLGIFTAATGGVEVIPRVRAFEVPSEAGHVLLYHLEADSGAAATPAARPDTAAQAGGPQAAPRRGTPGTTLVLRDLRSGQEVRIEEVTAFAMDDSARWLAYTVTSREAENDGAFLRNLSTGAVTTLLGGSGAYAALTFDRAGRQLAFLSDREDTNRDKPKHRLYHAALQGNTVRVTTIVTPDSAAAGMQLATGGVSFVRDGSALRFGFSPVPPDSIPADVLAEGAVYDLWHWQDPVLQPQQQIQARQAATRAHAMLYRIAARRIARLGNDTLTSVNVSDDGRVAVATTNLPYAIEAMWGEGGNDVYLIDVATGVRTLVVQRLSGGGFGGGVQVSPGSRYLTWYSDGHWHARDMATGRVVNMTAAVNGVSFAQETWDTPSTPSSWGQAGWTANDRSFLVNDRYDVWELDPAGQRAPRNLTDGHGRQNNITYRLVRTDTEERHLDPAQPALFRAFHNHSKQSGFASGRLDRVAAPSRIVMDDVNFGTPQKAKGADMFLVTRSTFRDFPNLWAGASLDRLARISDANPQQREFRWGTAELVEWRSDDNEPLQGILYKPDDFDPSRQYPMVVYFYEKLSDNLHNYNMTYPRNTTQPTWYVSNGYLVFFPDINYGTGYPGPDALKSVVPGVQSLIAKGFVDPHAVGVAGQSWGGYQIAHMITRSNIFRAAMAGAPVANMTSAYGGIRWASGLARAFQYERTQSRIGGSIWEYPLRFLENSPLFHADRIQTPLLMMHNDNDGAVPWYQGIEMFVAMRRLGKEVYMVNYNGDEHNPTKRANQADIALKTMEFFDHHLRGKPMPRWMAEGIPFLEKGRR